MAAPQGDPSSDGLRPSSSRASVSSARSGSATSFLARRLASPDRHALGAIDQGKLLRFGFGIFREFIAFQADLIFEQLALRAHRNVFARGHRERTGGKPGNAGEQHGRRARIRACDAEDQARVRDQAVVHAEHGRAQIADAAQAAVAALDRARDGRQMATRARAPSRSPCHGLSSPRAPSACAAARTGESGARRGACANPARRAAAPACRWRSAARARSQPAPALQPQGAGTVRRAACRPRPPRRRCRGTPSAAPRSSFPGGCSWVQCSVHRLFYRNAAGRRVRRA